jgi:hypothetical protein
MQAYNTNVVMKSQVMSSLIPHTECAKIKRTKRTHKI